MALEAGDTVESHGRAGHVIYEPPPRCATCGGHRIARLSGDRPIETRKLSIWHKIAELPMRQLAKSMQFAHARDWFAEERCEEAPELGDHRN